MEYSGIWGGGFFMEFPKGLVFTLTCQIGDMEAYDLKTDE